MDITVRRFGPPGREMVGLLQRAQRPRSEPVAFLLCRPIAQEAIRTSAMYRALSDRLAREGCDVLRFDYHGTGDSPGDEGEQWMDAWIDDLLHAHQLLVDESPSRPVHWFGMALGASLGARAAMRARIPPRHLVLWEPVLDGSVYLQALLDAHRQELSRELGLPWEQIVGRGREPEPELPGTVLGFDFNPRLVDELRGLQSLPLTALARKGTRLTCGVQAEHLQTLRHQLSDAARLHAVEQRTNWMSTEAVGTAIVPQEVTRTLLETLPA